MLAKVKFIYCLNCNITGLQLFTPHRLVLWRYFKFIIYDFSFVSFINLLAEGSRASLQSVCFWKEKRVLIRETNKTTLVSEHGYPGLRTSRVEGAGI